MGTNRKQIGLTAGSTGQPPVIFHDDLSYLHLDEEGVMRLGCQQPSVAVCFGHSLGVHGLSDVAHHETMVAAPDAGGRSRLRAAAAGFPDLGGTSVVGLEFGHLAEALGKALQ